MEHYSVMLDETIEGLAIRPTGTYVDGTLGRAGHSLEIAKRLTTGRLICFDLDQQAIEKSKIVLKDHLDKITFIHSNFADIKQQLANIDIHSIDGLVLDLGVSSPQFDESERGFSYRYDAKLDMRMDQTQSLTAYEIVNTANHGELARIFREYGEEKFASKIASIIVNERANKPIETTFELVEMIRRGYPAKVLHQKGHPAKQVFQALRIAVNNELKSVETVLEQAISMLNVDGRIAVISFHSLEDRIVKQCFKAYSTPPKGNRRLPQMDTNVEFELTNKKVIVASEEELNENNRSHSAKLRILKKVG